MSIQKILENRIKVIDDILNPGIMHIVGIPEAVKEIEEYLLTIEPAKRFPIFTNEFLQMLLVNALRNLTNEQRMELTKSLFVRLSEQDQKHILDFNKRNKGLQNDARKNKRNT